MERQELIKKIEELPPDRLAEVEDFVESIAGDDASGRKRLADALADDAIKNVGTSHDLGLLDQQRALVREVEEVLEEIAMSRAIDEGRKSNPATREEVFHILENAP